MQRITIWFFYGLSLFLLGLPTPIGAQEKESAIDPKADSILRQMSEYLDSLVQFSFNTENSLDTLLTTGQKLQMGRTVDAFVQRPDRFRANAKGDVLDQELSYDGKSITLFEKKLNYYATIEAPSTI